MATGAFSFGCNSKAGKENDPAIGEGSKKFTMYTPYVAYEFIEP